MSEASNLDGLTAIDRLRLYATDPETFSFDIDDAIAALEKYEAVERRADIAEQMAEALRALVDAKALSGVREQVAGWNGENRPVPYKERHPDRLGATLPKTNCGAVYALDDAMQAARAALSAWEASNPARQASNGDRHAGEKGE